jgi:large subunit ribosomal protein L21
MFAVIKTGGKQYRIAAEDTITIERLAGVAGDTIAFDHVLLFNDGATTHVGTPTVAGVTVTATLVEQARGEKVISFKKRRRQNSRRKKGHRQDLTVVKIAGFLTGGAKPEFQATKEPVAAAVAEATPSKARSASDEKAHDPNTLSLISGIGPTIEKKLRAAGINSWNDIAAWTDADVEKWDKELALRGRAKREEWVQQAQELLAGKPPRAKVDQTAAAAEKGE